MIRKGWAENYSLLHEHTMMYTWLRWPECVPACFVLSQYLVLKSWPASTYKVLGLEVCAICMQKAAMEPTLWDLWSFAIIFWRMVFFRTPKMHGNHSLGQKGSRTMWCSISFLLYPERLVSWLPQVTHIVCWTQLLPLFLKSRIHFLCFYSKHYFWTK